MEQTGNPAFTTSNIQDISNTKGDTMTKSGTYIKTGLLLIVTFIAAVVSWRATTDNAVGADIRWFPLFITSMVTLIVGMIISFNPSKAPILAFPFAILEGFLLGVISGSYSYVSDGIVGLAIFTTFAVFCAVYLGYALGFFKATPLFTKVIISSLLGIFIMYLFSWIFTLFGVEALSIYSNSNISLAASIFIVGIASFSLVMDFSFIDTASKQSMPKYFEWYSAYGLMVGLVWLYLEILRLFAKAASRN